MSSDNAKTLVRPLFASTVSTDWRWYRLDDVAEVFDCPHSTPPLVDDSNAPFVARSQDIRSGTFLTANAPRVSISTYRERIKRVEPRHGDLLYSREGTYFGIAAAVPKGIRVCLGQRMVLIRPDPCCADAGFLKYWLNAPQMANHVRGFRDGTVAERLNLPVIRGLAVALPRIDHQRAIARMLEALDDRIALLRETNATLEAIAQALFKSWFVDFDPVRAKSQGLAPAGLDESTAALFPDGFEESALGPVPAGWHRATMANVSAVGIGKTPPRKESHWFSGDSRHVRWASIRDMGAADAFLSETSEYLTAEAVQRFNVRVVPDRTVMLSFKLTVGRVAISDGEMTTNEAIAHFRLDPGTPLTSEFLYLALKEFDFGTLGSTSSIAEAVNSKTVRSLPVLVPSADVLQAFQQVVEPVFERLKLNSRQAYSLGAARDMLLPRLISGQLRLPEAERAIAAQT